MSKAALDEPNDNLLVNTMQTKNFSDKGFEILVHEDGSFTFSGTYTGEEPMYIYPMEIGNLKSGDYILSDGGASVDQGIQASMEIAQYYQVMKYFIGMTLNMIMRSLMWSFPRVSLRIT